MVIVPILYLLKVDNNFFFFFDFFRCYLLIYFHTEIRSDGVHVSVVSFAGDGVAGAVADGKKSRGIVSNNGEQKHHCWSSHPSKLCSGPCQRQHPRSYHRCNNMRTCCPHTPCLKSQHISHRPKKTHKKIPSFKLFFFFFFE